MLRGPHLTYTLTKKVGVSEVGIESEWSLFLKRYVERVNRSIVTGRAEDMPHAFFDRKDRQQEAERWQREREQLLRRRAYPIKARISAEPLSAIIHGNELVEVVLKLHQKLCYVQGDKEYQQETSRVQKVSLQRVNGVWGFRKPWERVSPEAEQQKSIGGAAHEVQKTDHPEDKSDRTEQAEQSRRADMVRQSGRMEQSGRADMVGQSGRMEQSRRADMVGQSNRMEQSSRTDMVGQSNKTDQIRPASQAAIPVEQVQFRGYDRLRAVAYANMYWEHPNPAYPYLHVDCTNFISQCLYAGRIPMISTGNRSTGWWFRGWHENWSYSWMVANSLRQLLSSGKAPMYAERRNSPEELELGDVICYDFDGNGHWQHNTIVTDKDANGMPLVNAHTTDSYHRYWEYTDSTAYTPNIKYNFFHIRGKE